MDVNSGLAVNRILGISKNMCLYWVKKYAKKIKPKKVFNERVEVIEMDKLYSFIERKNRIYVITLVSRDKRQIVGYDIVHAFNSFADHKSKFPSLKKSFSLSQFVLKHL